MPTEPRGPSRELVEIRFSSTLPLSYRDELERIVFFNRDQHRVADPLLAAVSHFGAPSIVQDGNSLRFSVPAFGPVQSLYALDENATPARLAGVVMFVRDRDSPDTMVVLHLAVHEDYAGDGPNAEHWVAPRLMSAVRNACLQIRGVAYLRVLYPSGRRIALPKANPAKPLP
jgi:hypothetical protein